MLDSEPRRLELERLRRDDPTEAAAVDELLEHVKAAPAEGLLVSRVPLPTPRQDLAPGVWVGPYQVERHLGHGGMGTVYLVHHRDRPDQPLALKRIRSDLEGRLVERFQAETQILGTLRHPGIVRLLDSGQHTDGSPYLVMEYVPGRRLDVHCREVVPDLAGRVRLILAVADAVAQAHRQEIVHRDLKPANVLVDADGRIRVTDFGLAKLVARVSGRGEATETALVVGTFPYMAPERLALKPRRDEPPGDVYALGVMLFELVAGRPPFVAHDPVEAHAQVLHEEAPRLRQVRPDVPPALEAIVERALECDPRHRIQDAGELAMRLRLYLAGLPVGVHGRTRAERLWRWAGRHRKPLLGWAASLGAALLVMIGVLMMWIRNLEHQRDGLRETMRSFWLASSDLAEKLPPSDPGSGPFYARMVGLFESVRDQGQLAAGPKVDRQVAVMYRHRAFMHECRSLGVIERAADPDLPAGAVSRAELDRAQGELEQARSDLSRSIDLLRPLPVQVVDPVERAWTEFDLFRSLSRRAMVRLGLGKFEAARGDSDEAYDLIRGLSHRFPDEPARLEAESHLLQERAILFGRTGQPDEARRAEADSLELARQASEADPGNSVPLNTVLGSLLRLAQSSAEPHEAERWLREAHEVADRLEPLLAEQGSASVSPSVARLRLGEFLRKQGRTDEALPILEEALERLDVWLTRSAESISGTLREDIRQELAACRP
jgi:tetratricopeptide (TPR) repeat protein/predicted Ser/Thr protein kinase